jgi:hypothetical protein
MKREWRYWVCRLTGALYELRLSGSMYVCEDNGTPLFKSGFNKRNLPEAVPHYMVPVVGGEK